MGGVRLMLDYLKPQTLLNEQDVVHSGTVYTYSSLLPLRAR
jgi:hypothetical protein